MAYPHAYIKTNIYMKPPTVPHKFTIPDLPQLFDRFTHAYKLLKNLYGLKDAGKILHDFLKNFLVQHGWVQSNIDGCLFTKSGMLLILYVDEFWCISPYTHQVDAEIKSLEQDYNLTNVGDLKDYLGTRFERHKDGSVTLTQPCTMEQIFDIVGINPTNKHLKLHDTPASSDCILDNNPDGSPI